MATLAFLALVLATAAPAMPRVHGGASPSGVSRALGVQSADGLERDLLAGLNTLRAKRAMRPLRLSRQLAAAAEHHSRSMARVGFFSHTSADGSWFLARIERFYRRPPNWQVYLVGENLFHGDPAVSAAHVLRRWLASPGHRRNLFGDWREVGFGAVRSEAAPGVFGGENVSIVTVDFGIRG